MQFCFFFYLLVKLSLKILNILCVQSVWSDRHRFLSLKFDIIYYIINLVLLVVSYMLVSDIAAMEMRFSVQLLLSVCLGTCNI